MKPDGRRAEVVVMAGPARVVTARRAAMRGPRHHYLARWTDDTSEQHRQRFDTEPAAVRHVARSRARRAPLPRPAPLLRDLPRGRRVPPNTAQRVMGHERASTTLDTRRTDDSSRILRALDDEGPHHGATGALPPA